MPKPLRAALYLRVSTTDQTTDNQLPDLQALADRRGFEIVQMFSENISAVKTRPEFERMLKAGHRGKFDVLMVWSLDRLHRSMTGALSTVLELDRLGVQLVSHKETWLDTGGPVRGLLVAICGWVAEQERLRIGDRTKAGLDRARRRGVRLGRPRIDVDHDRLLALRAEGMSVRAIAKKVGLSVGTVHGSLRGVQEGTVL